MDEKTILQEARARLIETGGRASQDFGTGRIVGQVLVHLYLQETECSLDHIGADLGMSKASVSIAVRQLEQLGLARKVWKSGDKRNYYKSADNIASALQQGVLTLVQQKVKLFGRALDCSLKLIDEIPKNTPSNEEVLFLRRRIKRAKKLQNGLGRVLGNPLVRLLAGIKS